MKVQKSRQQAKQLSYQQSKVTATKALAQRSISKSEYLQCINRHFIVHGGYLHTNWGYHEKSIKIYPGRVDQLMIDVMLGLREDL